MCMCEESKLEGGGGETTPHYFNVPITHCSQRADMSRHT